MGRQVKEGHKESLSAAQRLKVLRSWPVRHWPALLLCLLLLLLLGTGMLNLVRSPKGKSSFTFSPVILSGRCSLASYFPLCSPWAFFIVGAS